MASESNISIGQEHRLPFNLQVGEKVIESIRPLRNGFILSRVFGGFIADMVICTAAAIYLVMTQHLVLGLAMIPIFFVILAFLSIGPYLSYGKFKYWVTNYRVIGRRGTLGYSIDSIPLENVTDVIIHRSIVDRILNLSSLTIVPIGGTSGELMVSSTNYFPALRPDQAKVLQETIFELRNARKKETGKVV